jgi:hypothetical protein
VKGAPCRHCKGYLRLTAIRSTCYTGAIFCPSLAWMHDQNVVVLTLETTTTVDAPYSLSTFQLTDARGQRFVPLLAAPDFPSGRLSPGPAIGGTLVFNVPSDADTLILTYAPATTGRIFPTIRVQLSVMLFPSWVQGSTINTSSVRGPCTPSTRLSSISEVAEGPEMKVIGRSPPAWSRAIASGTSPTICSARTTHRW